MVGLSGCAVIDAVDRSTDGAQRAALDAWIGAERSALRKEWGEPQVVVPMADGGEVWTYLRTYTPSRGGAGTTVSTAFTLDRAGRVTSWRRA